MCDNHVLEEVVPWARFDTVRPVSGKEEKVKHLQDLLEKESKFYESLPFFSQADYGAKKAQVNNIPSSWRSELCKWKYGVVDHYNLDREIVSVAANYLDLVVAASSQGTTTSSTSKNDYVLLAVASLSVAVKEYNNARTHGGSCPLGTNGLAALCQGARFNVQDIEESERLILSILDGASDRPSSLAFLKALLRLCPGWKRDRSRGIQDDVTVLRCTYQVAQHLLELAAFEPKFSLLHRPSVVAYAAVLCAAEVLQPSLPLPSQARVGFLNGVAEASGGQLLLPGRHEVLQAIRLFKCTCPKAFEDDGGAFVAQFLDEIMPTEVPAGGGRDSPVGVAEAGTSKLDS